MNHKLLHWRHNRKGLSLIELMVALGITVVIVSLVSAYLIEGVRFQDFLSEQTSAIDSARRSYTEITKYVREIADGDNGEYAIVEAESSSFTFYSDIDADEATEQVQYYIDGTNLKRIVIEPIGQPATYLPGNAVEKIISSYVINDAVTGNPVFTYYNSDYPSDVINNPLVDPVDITEVSLVKIQLDVNVNPNKIPNTSTIETFVQIRNLKSNL